jgi:hypothetical protein
MLRLENVRHPASEYSSSRNYICVSATARRHDGKSEATVRVPREQIRDHDLFMRYGNRRVVLAVTVL